MIEPFVINQKDENITLTNTLPNVMSDLFVYRVPLGSNILLNPSDVLALHLLVVGGGAAEPTTQVRMELRSPVGGGEAEPILGNMLYQMFTPTPGIGEFRHVERLVTLQIPATRRVIEQAYIAVQAKSVSVIDASLCWFELRTHEIKV